MDRGQHASFVHRQQQPIKSSKGGYLRCPFTINQTYAELATKHIQAQQQQQAQADANKYRNKDGIGEEGGGSAGRVWGRAGVGAASLSTSQKVQQQRLAEHIYNSNNNNNHHHQHSGAEQSSSQLPPPQGGGGGGTRVKKESFAVDHTEKNALQRLLPRALRRERAWADSEGETGAPSTSCIQKEGRREAEDDEEEDENLVKHRSTTTKTISSAGTARATAHDAPHLRPRSSSDGSRGDHQQHQPVLPGPTATEGSPRASQRERKRKNKHKRQRSTSPPNNNNNNTTNNNNNNVKTEATHEEKFEDEDEEAVPPPSLHHRKKDSEESAEKAEANGTTTTTTTTTAPMAAHPSPGEDAPPSTKKGKKQKKKQDHLKLYRTAAVLETVAEDDD